MNQINLSNIKVVFIDFDDTAIVHLDHSRWDDFFTNAFNGEDKMYTLGERVYPMPGMYKFVKCINEANIPLYCLSVGYMSPTAVSKKKLLDKVYGIDSFKDVLIVGTWEYKTVLMLKYCNNFGLKSEEVLIVDDHVSTREEALSKGFNIASPQEIACRYLYHGDMLML